MDESLIEESRVEGDELGVELEQGEGVHSSRGRSEL